MSAPLERRVLLDADGADFDFWQENFNNGSIVSNPTVINVFEGQSGNLESIVENAWRDHGGDVIVRLKGSDFDITGVDTINLVGSVRGDRDTSHSGPNGWFVIDGDGIDTTVLNGFETDQWQGAGANGPWTRIKNAQGQNTNIFYADWDANFGYSVTSAANTPQLAVGQRSELLMVDGVRYDQVQIENVEVQTYSSSSPDFRFNPNYINPNGGSGGLPSVWDLQPGEFTIIELGQGESIVANGTSQGGDGVASNISGLGTGNNRFAPNRVYVRVPNAGGVANAFESGTVDVEITGEDTPAGPLFNLFETEKVIFSDFTLRGVRTFHREGAIETRPGDELTNLLIDSVRVTDTGGVGVFVRGAAFSGNTNKITINNSDFSDNGAQGVALGGENILIEDTSTNRNNWRGSRAGFGGFRVAGVKFNGGNNITIDNLTSVENSAAGLWFDIGVYDVEVRNSDLSRNKGVEIFDDGTPDGIPVVDLGSIPESAVRTGSGLYIEISGQDGAGNRILIQNTDIEDNAGFGVRLDNGRNVEFSNVTVADNGLSQMMFMASYRGVDGIFGDLPDAEVRERINRFGNIRIFNSTIESAASASAPGSLLIETVAGFNVTPEPGTDTAANNADNILQAQRFIERGATPFWAYGGLRESGNTFRSKRSNAFVVGVSDNGTSSSARTLGDYMTFAAINQSPGSSTFTLL
ncbi:MAG: right-handed parallel beta-helix repeat-containing protein [Planctomycetota bacterium]